MPRLAIVLLLALAVTGAGAQPAPVAQWRMDEGSGTVVRDSSGHGVDCGVSRVSWVRGERAMEFKGRGGYLEAKDAAAGNLRGAFTIAFWIKPDTWADQYSAGIVSKKRDDASRGYVIYGDGFAPTKITLRAAGTEGGHPMLTSASDVDEGIWQHWAVTYDAAARTATWYKNGRRDKAYADIRIGDLANDTPLRVGYAHTWGGSYDGLMRDLRLYDCALTPEQVRALYGAALPADKRIDVPIRWRIAPTAYPSADVVTAGCTVRDAGARGDGRTDDTRAFQAAIASMARAGGGVVFVPAGRYVIRGALKIPTGVTLRGDWQVPSGKGPIGGSILMAYAGRGDADDRPFIALRQSSGVSGLTIWYPEQKPDRIVPYPFTIEQMGTTAGTVENVTLVNSYNGIRTDKGSALHYIHNVYGSPLSVGIEIGFVSDTGRVDCVDFGPEYWAQSGLPGAPGKDNPHAKWMAANGTALLFRRYEWIYSAFVSVRGYHTGIWMHNQADLGETNGQMYRYSITNCGIAVDIVDANFAGLSFTKCTLSGREYGIVTRPTFNTRLLMHSCTVTGGLQAALLDGVANQSMLFESCTFGGDVERISGDLVMLNCSLEGKNDRIRLGPRVNAVTIAGATFGGPARIVDRSESGNVAISADPLPAATVPEYPRPVDRPLKPGKPALFVVRPRAKLAATDDDTPAIRKALDAARANGGGIVLLPAGLYQVRGYLTVPTGVELRGSHGVEHHTRGLGTIVRVYAGRSDATGRAAITMQAGSGLRGLTFYYPEQRHEAIAPYSYLVRGQGAGIYVVNVTAMNPYQFVDFYTHRCDRHLVSYAAGAPLKTGIAVGGGSVGGEVRNVQFNPHYWAWSPFPDNQGVSTEEQQRGKNPPWTYEYRNLEAFVLGDCKGEKQYQNTIYGSHTGLHFVEQNGTGASGMVLGHGTDGSMVSVAFDGLSPQGIDVINSQLVSMHCIDVQDQSGKTYVRCGPSLRSTARLTNTTLWGNPIRSVVVEGGALQVDLASFCHYGPLVSGGDLRLRGIYLGERMGDGPDAQAQGTGSIEVTGALSPNGLAGLPGVTAKLDARTK